MVFNKYELQKSRLKRMVSLYAEMMLSNTFDYKKLQNVYNKAYDPNYAEFNIKKIIRQRSVQEILNSSVIEVYRKQNITQASVVKEEKQLLKATKADNDNTNRLKILQTWGKRIELDPKQTTTKQSDSYEFTKHLPDGSKQQLKAKQTKEIDTPGSIDTGNNDE